jgi:hypothetical protein
MQKHFIWFLLILCALAAGGSTQLAFGAEKDSSNQASSGTSDKQVTLKDTQNKVAEIHKSKGQMRTTTNDDRWAAAKRHADRRAKALKKAEGGSK